MSKVSLENFVCSAVAQACNIDRSGVSTDTNLLDLDMDSLTLVSVLAQVEAVHDVELTPEEILQMLEVSRISELVTRLAELLPSEAALRDE